MSDHDIMQELESLKNKITELENKKMGIRGYFKKALAKTNILVGVLIALISTSVIVYAAQIMFSPGEVISSADVNSNFTELYDQISVLDTRIDQLELLHPVIGSPMAQIPAGCFEMGDAFAEGFGWELPVHDVCITAFEMDVHEITNAEYAACVDDSGCTAPASTDSWTRSPYYGDGAYDDFPVIYVDWYRVDEYCAWAGKRLPTEAEWEYAARGGLAGNRYPWGDSIDCGMANYARGSSTSDCWDYDGLDNDTHPVESYSPNGYGLYDMAGNVNEWTADWFAADYYDVSPTNDPQGPPAGEYGGRVLRDGSWPFDTSALGVAVRGPQDPGLPDPGGVYVGGRCAR